MSIPFIEKPPAIVPPPGIDEHLFVTVVVVTAHYTAYSYIEPFVKTLRVSAPTLPRHYCYYSVVGHYWQRDFRETG